MSRENKEKRLGKSGIPFPAEDPAAAQDADGPEAPASLFRWVDWLAVHFPSRLLAQRGFASSSSTKTCASL